jgi:protein-S-isoprenylcysteine O-methyltransferase Ste14
VTSLEAHLWYALAWLSFGVAHSLLAREAVKARLRPLLGAYYRLTYNIVAVLHIALVWAVGWLVLSGRGQFDLPAWGESVLWAGHVGGWLLLVAGLAGYDLGRLVQNHLMGIDAPEDEPLRLDGLHRYLRHPLYSAGFLILWGRAVGEFELATALWGSLYLLIGAVFEERGLLRLYGEDYADYRRRVPAFIPWKGRVLR